MTWRDTEAQPHDGRPAGRPLGRGVLHAIAWLLAVTSSLVGTATLVTLMFFRPGPARWLPLPGSDGALVLGLVSMSLPLFVFQAIVQRSLVQLPGSLFALSMVAAGRVLWPNADFFSMLVACGLLGVALGLTERRFRAARAARPVPE